MPSESCKEFGKEFVDVDKVTYLRTDVYYDFTVDEFHNYVLAGVVHHNTGKSLMGMCAIHAHANGPYRALVFCPGQLTGKWKREIEQTLPGVKVTIIEDWKKLIEIKKDADRQLALHWKELTETMPSLGKPLKHRPVTHWYIIARDRAKLGAKWKPAVVKRKSLDDDGNQIEILTCPTCGKPVMNKDSHASMDWLNKNRRVCAAPLDEDEPEGPVCGGHLWSYHGELRRWAPADYIKKHMRGFFDYLIIDEVHEEKSAASAQANAAGALISATRKQIALTGTLIGGYADHIRPLLFRLAPRSLVDEGLAWSAVTEFNERYGRIETRVSEKESGSDNRMSRGSSRSVTKNVRPGIMPSLFGRHLMPNTVFLSLDEVADQLPPLETVIPVQMDFELAQSYRKIEKKLTEKCREMAVKGDRRLLGAMLQTLIGYPDHPFGWNPVGYGDNGRFIEVVKPENHNPEKTYAKEKQLLQLLKDEHRAGRQSWVYVQLTDKRDVAGRLEKLAAGAGLRTKVLRSSVPLAKREAWINRHGGDVDVVFSHPKLVETGLDLFDKGGAHNFSTLVFYETGYNLFTLRQASRRAWRIGQQQDCRVYLMYYTGTFQERAMELMGRKLSAAIALEGQLSSAGLAAMAEGEASIEMEMARQISENIAAGDASRAWGKIARVHGDDFVLPDILFEDDVFGDEFSDLDELLAVSI